MNNYTIFNFRILLSWLINIAKTVECYRRKQSPSCGKKSWFSGFTFATVQEYPNLFRAGSRNRMLNPVPMQGRGEGRIPTGSGNVYCLFMMTKNPIGTWYTGVHTSQRTSSRSFFRLTNVLIVLLMASAASAQQSVFWRNEAANGNWENGNCNISLNILEIKKPAEILS